jgi:NADP-dependent 3-hydroxy acid dehydrogenase YdfG
MTERQQHPDSENSENGTLAGRLALITGASSGIGEATALRLAAAGATVVLTARREERLDELARRIGEAGGTAHPLPLDVTDASAVGDVARRVAEEVGRVDLVFANAGVMLPEPIENLRRDQWDHQVDLNLKGLLYTVEAFLPALVESAADGAAADLVLTSSVAGAHLFPGFAVYSATKAFVSHLADHMRMELGPKFVRTTAIEPGIVSTELQDHVTDPGVQEWLAGAAESMKLLDPEDIARVVAFIVSQPRHVNLSHVRIMPTEEQS